MAKVFRYAENASFYIQAMFLTVIVDDSDRAFLECRYQRGMVFQHGERTVKPR